MALKITEQNSIFVIEGSINSATAKSFQNHLNILINHYSEVTINIDKVNNIDEHGLSILREFHLNALRFKRGFWIIGNGCKEIYDEFKFEKVA